MSEWSTRRIFAAPFMVGLLVMLAWIPPTGGGDKEKLLQAVLPTELAWVPQEAACFVHIRNGDIKAGKQVLLLNALLLEFGHPVGQVLKRQADISGEEVESLTIVFPTAPNLAHFINPIPRGEPLFQYEFDKPDRKDKAIKEEVFPNPRSRSPLLWVVKTANKTVLERVRKQLASAKSIKEKGGLLFLDPLFPGLAFHFADDFTLVYGRVEWVKRGLQQPLPKSAGGPLADALKRAAEKHHLTVGVRGPGNLAEKGFGSNEPNPGILRALEPLQPVQSATFTVDFGKQTRWAAELRFAREAEAQAAVPAVQDALVFARVLRAGWLLTVYRSLLSGGLPDEAEEKDLLVFTQATAALERGLRQAKVEQKAKVIEVNLVIPTDLPAFLVQAEKDLKALHSDPKIQEARLRNQTKKNLGLLVLGLQRFANTYDLFLPAHAIYKNGKPLLSWRVAILPFIGEADLYKQFRLNEPWDSPHNLKLLPLMPKVFAPAGVKTKGLHITYVQAMVGPDTSWRPPVKKETPLDGRGDMRYSSNFSPGVSNGIALVETVPGVPWTKPEDVPYDAKKAVRRLGGVHPQGFYAAFFDGSVQCILEINEADLRILLNPSSTKAAGPYKYK